MLDAVASGGLPHVLLGIVVAVLMGYLYLRIARHRSACSSCNSGSAGCSSCSLLGQVTFDTTTPLSSKSDDQS
ncbi:hypothetical protein [Cohaesibacter sp. ES.047]|uniref:hypothetical protein n=1 Tax=Cohaesibacter sp. ES.047 TaxID=1798205 RepID=UPI000BB898A4|nr:hypothetical protein [Cohaesibacter sp. ES.047]